MVKTIEVIRWHVLWHLTLYTWCLPHMNLSIFHVLSVFPDTYFAKLHVLGCQNHRSVIYMTRTFASYTRFNCIFYKACTLHLVFNSVTWTLAYFTHFVFFQTRTLASYTRLYILQDVHFPLGITHPTNIGIFLGTLHILGCLTKFVISNLARTLVFN